MAKRVIGKKTKATKKAKATKATKATRRGKASSTRGEPKAASAARALRVRQVRSGIGHAGIYRRTLRALGLKHHQDEVLVKDGSSTRGMLRKVHHLVRVTREEA